MKDAIVNDFNGTFTDWKITLWGECIDASKQELHPMPKEDDDDHGTISAVVSTTTVSRDATETGLSANPTDHIDRPVKPTAEATKTSTSYHLLPTVDVNPPYVTPTAWPSQSATAAPSATPSSADHFLPHYFPTFGVSKRTQIWIYGALASIILFCAGLGIYVYIQRRNRLRRSRDDYEFDVLDENDDDDDDDAAKGIIGGGAKKARGKRGRKNKRGGDLYDAFAGESDEDLLHDEDEEEVGYKDRDDGVEERGRSQAREYDEKMGD